MVDIPHIEQQLSRLGIIKLPAHIPTALKSLKSGQDTVFQDQSPENMALITSLHLLSKVEADLYELLPRAIVFCKDSKNGEALIQMLDTLSTNRDLKYILIHDKGDKVKQRNVLYEGVDIVVGTPKRICELYFQNGINLKHMKVFFILDGDQIALQGGLTQISRLHESLPKCQKVVFYNIGHDKLQDYMANSLINPKILKINP